MLKFEDCPANYPKDGAYHILASNTYVGTEPWDQDPKVLNIVVDNVATVSLSAFSLTL